MWYLLFDLFWRGGCGGSGVCDVCALGPLLYASLVQGGLGDADLLEFEGGGRSDPAVSSDYLLSPRRALVYKFFEAIYTSVISITHASFRETTKGGSSEPRSTISCFF